MWSAALSRTKHHCSSCNGPMRSQEEPGEQMVQMRHLKQALPWRVATPFAILGVVIGGFAVLVVAMGVFGGAMVYLKQMVFGP